MLINEYVLTSDMRLITCEYGVCLSKAITQSCFSAIRLSDYRTSCYFDNIIIHVSLTFTPMQATVDNVNDTVQWNRADISGKVAMRIGSEKQVSTTTSWYVAHILYMWFSTTKGFYIIIVKILLRRFLHDLED